MTRISNVEQIKVDICADRLTAYLKGCRLPFLALGAMTIILLPSLTDVEGDIILNRTFLWGVIFSCFIALCLCFIILHDVLYASKNRWNIAACLVGLIFHFSPPDIWKGMWQEIIPLPTILYFLYGALFLHFIIQELTQSKKENLQGKPKFGDRSPSIPSILYMVVMVGVFFLQFFRH